ncbi:MAG: hypothetical protein AB7U97_05835 [Pirellulales bacterium]
MIRRTLVFGSACLLSLSLLAPTFAQSPSSLAERIKQLRRDWSSSEDEAEPTPADEPTPVAPPRAGSAQPRNRLPESGLPQIEARSLLPRTSGGAPTATYGNSQPTRRVPSGADVRNAPIARRSPTTAPPTPTATPAYTARRSPTQRQPLDVNPEALHDQLTGQSHTAAAPTSPPAGSSELSPTILDDFAAGLAQESPKAAPAAKASVATPPATVVTKPKPTTSQGPITLPTAKESTIAEQEPEPQVAEPQPVAPQAPAAKVDRYASPGIPSIGTLRDSSPSSSTPSSSTPATNSASGRTLVGKANDDSEAAKAFQYDAIPLPAASPSKISNAKPPESTLPIAPRDAMTGDAAEARRESFIEGEQAASDSGAGPGVLVTSAAPAITSDIRGPRQIAIGREASYRVRLQNQGGSAADAVVATVRIPSWAEVANTTATSGVVRQIAADDSAAILQWQIPRLNAQAGETLSLDLVPRVSRPLELGVTWTHDPVHTRTVVEVQEPKLKLEVTGPDEVLFNKSHVYRLTLSNPGTGVAENVRINLMPPGGGQEAVSTFEVGDLQPGVSKTAEVELTAREAGKLSVQAVALADGDLKSAAIKEIFCRKPELEVDWRGPEMQYAGTPATYFFRVRNPGTAAADDVVVKVSLPAGADFVSASEGHAIDNAKREVAWRVGSLGPGDDCYMELRCTVNTPGENKLAVNAATTAGDLTDSKQGVTNVVALADLKLDVSDPPGPVAVGQEAVYEIRVTNRGASAAEEVNVVGLFSNGLEPETGEGAPYTVSDGRVAFRTINKLPAGQDIVLQIRAKATEAGTHVFRAEVLCRDLEIKLAAEETTRFYKDDISREPATASEAPAEDAPATNSQAAADSRYDQAAR